MTKEENQIEKQAKFKILYYMAPLALFMSFVLVFVSIKYINFDKKEVFNGHRKIENAEHVMDEIRSGNLSASQMQADVDDLLGITSNFSEINEAKKTDKTANNKPDEVTLEMQSIFTAYLDGLLIQREKLNKLIPLLNEDLKQLEEYSDTSLKDKYPNVENLNSPVLRGFFEELSNTPLYLFSDGNQYRVRVDYDKLKQVYGSYSTSFHTHLMTLHEDIMKFGYTRLDGEIDAKVIYNRLKLLDEIQNENLSKDNFYWEEERYQLAILFTGYGTEEKPMWDEERIQQMEEIAGYSDANPYVLFAQQISESIREEENYGENSIRIANQWMYEAFREYRDHIESQTKEGAS